MTGRFFNYMERQYTDEAVEQDGCGNWFIKIGFAGSNTPANNAYGYASRGIAEQEILRHQFRSGRPDDA